MKIGPIHPMITVAFVIGALIIAFNIYPRDQIKIHVKTTGHIDMLFAGFNDSPFGRTTGKSYGFSLGGDQKFFEQDAIFSKWPYNFHVRPAINIKPADSKKSYLYISILRNDVPCGEFSTPVEFFDPPEIENYREYEVLCN